MTNFDNDSEEFQASEQQSLLEFFRNSPLVGADLDLEREPDYGRDVEIPE